MAKAFSYGYIVRLNFHLVDKCFRHGGKQECELNHDVRLLHAYRG
jgi:hypothetical protein